MHKKVWLIVYLIFCMGLLSFSYVKAQPLEGRVINIVDANTFELETKDEGNYTIKWWGIDCPEPEQPYGIEALKSIEDLILKKKVVVDIKGKDRKGIRLGVVYLKKGIPLNELILENGHAWAELNYAKGHYLKKQDDAKSNKLGLWKFPNPVEPWVYRRQQSMKMAKSR